MKLELKNIKLLASLSEETPAYTATLYADGKKVGDVSNHGHGGCDEFHGDYALLKKVEEYVKANHPKIDMSQYNMEPLDASLETWCHTEAWASVEKKNFASKLSRNIMYIKAGEKNVYGAKIVKGRKDEQIAAYKAKIPGITILNTLPADEAFKLYNDNVAVR